MIDTLRVRRSAAASNAEERLRWLEVPVAFGVATVLYAAGLIWLGTRGSLWGDEGFTAAMVRLPWGVMLGDLSRIDVNMGLYYAIVGLVTRVVGTGEAALRLVSALSVAASVPLVARLARQLLGHRRGTAAAVLFAANPFTIVLGATARPYGLLVFGALMSTLALLRAMRTDRPRDWIGLAVLDAALLYVHLLAVLVIAAHGVYAICVLARSWRRGHAGQEAVSAERPSIVLLLPRVARTLLLPAGVLVVASIPTALFIAPADTLNWVAPPTVRMAVEVVGAALGGRGLAPLISVAAAAGAVRLARRGAPHAGLLVSLVAVPVIAVVVLLPIQSLLVHWYLAPLLVPTTLLAAHGAGALPSRRTARAAVAVSVLVAAVSVVRGARAGTLASPQDWREASARLDTVAGAADAVGFPNAFYRIVAEYYGGRSSAPGWTAARAVLPDAGWGSLRAYELDHLKRTRRQARRDVVVAQAGSRPSVWLVGPREPLLEDAVAALTGAGYRVVEVVELRGVQLVHLAQ